MDGAKSEHVVREPLTSARERLADVLPPQSAKLVEALQFVDLAMQYSALEGQGAKVMKVAKRALRALNSIENRRALPPAVSTSISRAISEIVRAVRALEAHDVESALRQIHTESYDGADRRARAPEPYDRHLPRRRRDDDTVDGLTCLDESLFGSILADRP